MSGSLLLTSHKKDHGTQKYKQRLATFYKKKKKKMVD
jgi:hypothetical protein